MDHYKVCPRCKQKYTQHSAISRIDNKANICPTCGIKEALIQFIKRQNPYQNYNDKSCRQRENFVF